MNKMAINPGVIEKYLGCIVWECLQNRVYKATKYISPSLVIKVTRKRFGGKIHQGSNLLEFSLVMGQPNYAEKKFIRKCHQAGELFPIKRIQLKTI